MNIKKLENKLGIKPIDEEVSEKIEKSLETDENIVLYTENPILQNEIETYKNDRRNSINILRDARDKISEIIESQTNSVKVGGDAKDIDSYAKLINTLTGVVGKIDEISNPNKVEMYIDPKAKQKELADGNITNSQTNIFLGSPTDLIKIMKQTKEKEEENKIEI